MGGRWRLALSNNVENLLLISQVLDCVLLLATWTFICGRCCRLASYLLAAKVVLDSSTHCYYNLVANNVVVPASKLAKGRVEAASK
jgi:hypothetical protein